jgi:hypothetical protein
MAVSRPQPWSLIGLAIWDPLGLEGGHGGGDVVGHEVELGPAALLGRMHGELGRW